MDEYRKLTDEFHFNEDEFNEQRKRVRTKAKPQSSSKVLKLLCASSMLVMVLPGYYHLYQMSENSGNASQGEIIDINDGNNQSASDNLSNNSQGDEMGNIVIEYEKIICSECEGVGIICPGDPNFGYDRGNGHGYEGCHGTGYSICPDIWCHDGIKTCQNCKGSGIFNGVNCEICRGKGIVDCEFCHNTGIAECISKDSHYTCPSCNGSGYVLLAKEE